MYLKLQTRFHFYVVALLWAMSMHAAAITCTQQPNGVIDPTVDCLPAATCDGIGDDGPIFEAAMNVLNSNPSGGTLRAPAKTCLVNKTLEINRSHVSIHCAGIESGCSLVTSISNIPQISSRRNYPGVHHISIKGLVLRRTVAATEGGDGIDFSGWVDSSTIDSVTISHSHNDLVLGPCTISRARNLSLINAVQDNLVLRPNSGEHGNTLQWDLDSIGVGGAGRFGIYVTSANSPVTYPGVILGDWRNLHAWSNTVGSVSIQAAQGIPINDLRIDKSWFCCSNPQSNASWEVYVNAGGGYNNRIQNSTIEIGVGHCLALDGTNKDFTVSGSKLIGCQKSGLLSYAEHLVLNGVISNSNGVSTTGHGVELRAGTAVISGLWATGNSGSGMTAHVDNIYGSAGDLTGNAAGALTTPIGTTLSASKICAVKGVSGLCK